MIDQKDLSKKMSKDIDEMEEMHNVYLQFAKTQSKEITTDIQLSELFREINKSFDNNNLDILSIDEINLKGRPLALRRSFENVIQNGLT